ncbi:FAD-dependent monooxygenase [Corynebacterium mayonis]|uniref:FAD-dependent monooxygenase n=1 Tax=Corynebacterium mayonis TaxID=3062461 RepID=UPI00314062B9
MHFHNSGYVSRNPLIHDPKGTGIDRPAHLPDTMDVLIVGSGPAGAIAAAQLSMFPHVHTRIVERRDGRLELGQADGIQARSVETFQAFRFANEITEEAYRITEMSFWGPDKNNPDNIVRGARPIDDEGGISEFPHLIVNQARVLDYFLRFAKRGPARIEPDYGFEVTGLRIEQGQEYPVVAQLVHSDGTQREVRAKYVIGCDGARSTVRKSIGRSLKGDQANQAWGVMDVVVDTDFPDWRTKCSIHSKNGSILHIPREGGFLARVYVDLGIVSADDNRKIRETPVEKVIEKANAILHPYSIDVKDVAWSSIYEVGHRLVDGFDECDHDDEDAQPRVFLTGDACHTHSAKAGQGMNVSMQDGFNIAWKLGQVLSGTAPARLLRTYHNERQPAAANLIKFDKEWSTLMATPVEELENPTAVEDYYVAAEEFAAGFLTEYEENLITGDATHQALAAGFPVGRRFKSYPAMRRADANLRHLGHAHLADGRYRIYVFADRAHPADADSKVAKLAEHMHKEDSFFKKYTPADGPGDATFAIQVIYQQYYRDFEITDVSPVFRPRTGSLMVELWDNVWAAHQDGGQDIFDARNISRDGVVVVVRPDQYVGAVVPLENPEALDAYFSQALLPQR